MIKLTPALFSGFLSPDEACSLKLQHTAFDTTRSHLLSVGVGALKNHRMFLFVFSAMSADLAA